MTAQLGVLKHHHNMDKPDPDVSNPNQSVWPLWTSSFHRLQPSTGAPVKEQPTHSQHQSGQLCTDHESLTSEGYKDSLAPYAHCRLQHPPASPGAWQGSDPFLLRRCSHTFTHVSWLLVQAWASGRPRPQSSDHAPPSSPRQPWNPRRARQLGTAVAAPATTASSPPSTATAVFHRPPQAH